MNNLPPFGSYLTCAACRCTDARVRWQPGEAVRDGGGEFLSTSTISKGPDPGFLLFTCVGCGYQWAEQSAMHSTTAAWEAT